MALRDPCFVGVAQRLAAAAALRVERSSTATVANRSALQAHCANNCGCVMRYAFVVVVVATLLLATLSARGVSTQSNQRTAAVVMAVSTVPDEHVAASVSRALVEERLVACVNVVRGVSSTYRWQDKVITDSELLLLMKTRASLVHALRARLIQLHPYQVPELIVHAVTDGNDAYLDWVRQSTARE
ncbi:unnamed protein product [Agarophyton chilense]